MLSPEALAFRRYRKHPLEIVDKWLGVKPWDMQREILTALFQPNVRRVGVKSAHSVGKTFMAAIAALTWLYGGKDRIVLTTAPTGRQVRKLLWREIRRIWQGCKDRGTPLGGEMPPNAPELVLGGNHFAIGFSSNDAVNVQGFHAPGGVLVIMDEANGVNEDIWDALAGVLTGQNDRLLAIANPTESAGPFFSLWKDPDCVKFTISALDTPNVKAGHEVVPGMISRAWVEDRKRAWGEDSNLYQSRVLARFPASSDDRLIPLSWLDIAKQRHAELEEATSSDDPATRESGWTGQCDLGLDVARYGGDTTVIAQAHTQGIRALHKFRQASTTDTADWAMGLSRLLKARSVRTDATGLGAGVHDMLHRELGAPAMEMIAGASASDPARFINARAEWGWHMRCLMDPQRDGGAIAVPSDDALLLQLTEYKWQQPKGRIQLEPKDDLKKRIKCSPDEADACMYALAPMYWAPDVSVDPEAGYVSNPWTV